MNRICIFLSIFLQTCTPAKIVGVAAPGTNDSWIQLLVRGIARIEAIDSVFSESADLEEDSKTFELERTLSIGAPNASTIVRGLTVDEKGSIYIAGDTDQGVYNVAGVFGIQDIILGKYDSQMNPIWTKQIGNPRVRLKVEDIAVDSNENIYITGSTKDHFRGSKQEGEDDLFLIKFDSGGNELWSLQSGILNYSILPSEIALDSFGNIYITGKSTGPFGGPLSGPNGFIIKFDSNGNRDWVKQIAIPTSRSFPKGLAINKTTNDIYITGSGNADYEKNITPGIGIDDLFILKYDSNGNGRFFAQLGFVGKSFHSESITVDPLGNVLVGGSSNGRFGSELGGASWLGTIVKYDSTGARQWIRQFGPLGDSHIQAQVNSIITDKNGNIFTTGSTNGNILDGGDPLLGDQDAFITKYNSSGQSKWIERIGVRGAVISGDKLKFDPTGNLYVIGNTNRGINGAPMRGTTDIFVVKYK
ncbi:SBBP repeat beta-propeller lipoprotein, LipL53 family [Leptospira weilii]|uniref:SBBP repeat beta-propeller lipoprotein, LipL53 family n=1 Tax=Leptospira weilii TaxID=28184 RepID=UPI000773D8DA|nr:SBBP repeat-containing protein [Leptospira weilii]